MNHDSQPGEPTAALEQRTIEIAQVVVTQVANGEPQVLLGDRAEDLGRGALVLGLLGAEMDPAAPHPIVGTPQGEPNSDTLSFEFDGGKIVNDGFAYCRC